MKTNKQTEFDIEKKIEHLLKKRFERQPPRDCSAFDLLIFDYAHDMLDGEERELVKAHLRQCNRCFCDYLDLLEYKERGLTDEDVRLAEALMAPKGILNRKKKRKPAPLSLLKTYMETTVDLFAQNLLMACSAEINLARASEFTPLIAEVYSEDQRLQIELTVEKQPNAAIAAIHINLSFYAPPEDAVAVNYRIVERDGKEEQVLAEGRAALEWIEQQGVSLWRNRDQIRIDIPTHLRHPLLILQPVVYAPHNEDSE